MRGKMQFHQAHPGRVFDQVVDAISGGPRVDLDQRELLAGQPELRVYQGVAQAKMPQAAPELADDPLFQLWLEVVGEAVSDVGGGPVAQFLGGEADELPVVAGRAPHHLGGELLAGKYLLDESDR